MAKISRFTASEVATKMVNDVYKDRESLIRGRIQEMCEKGAKTQIPQAVLEFCEKWSEYLTLRTHVSIACLDENRKIRCWVMSPVSFMVPVGKNTLEVLGADSDELYKYHEMLCELRREKNSLVNDIMNTLLDLGTTKRVATEFPVAVPYLTKMEIMPESSDKSCKCEQLIKTIEAEREKDKGPEISYYNHPV